jgi:hypothetical protein
VARSYVERGEASVAEAAIITPLGGAPTDVSHNEVHHRQAVVACLDCDLRPPAGDTEMWAITPGRCAWSFAIPRY